MKVLQDFIDSGVQSVEEVMSKSSAAGGIAKVLFLLCEYYKLTKNKQPPAIEDAQAAFAAFRNQSDMMLEQQRPNTGASADKNGKAKERRTRRYKRKQAKKEQDDGDQDALPPEEAPKKSKFYNAELEQKTAEIQQAFLDLQEQLAVQRENIDKDAFYAAIEDLNYGGVEKFTTSPTKRLVKHHEHIVEQKFKFRDEHQKTSNVGQAYSQFQNGFIVEPANGKGLNYKLIDKKPLKFYDQVLTQDVIKKQVFKDRLNTSKSPDRTVMKERYHMHQDGL